MCPNVYSLIMAFAYSLRNFICTFVIDSIPCFYVIVVSHPVRNFWQLAIASRSSDTLLPLFILIFLATSFRSRRNGLVRYSGRWDQWFFAFGVHSEQVASIRYHLFNVMLFKFILIYRLVLNDLIKFYLVLIISKLKY